MWGNTRHPLWVLSCIRYICGFSLSLFYFCKYFKFFNWVVLKFIAYICWRGLETLITNLDLMVVVRLALFHLKQVKFLGMRCLRFWIQTQHLWDLCRVWIREFKDLGWVQRNHPALLSQRNCNQPQLLQLRRLQCRQLILQMFLVILFVVIGFASFIHCTRRFARFSPPLCLVVDVSFVYILLAMEISDAYFSWKFRKGKW